MELKLDEASTCLLALMIALLMYQSTRRSDAPLYHPILLGRQAEASKVRHANESPIWTNATSTSGRLVVRPANDIKTLRDIIHGLDGDFKVKVLGLAARLVSLAANLGASTEQKRIVGVACESSEGKCFGYSIQQAAPVVTEQSL